MAKPPLPPAPSNAREGEAREVGEEGGPAGRHVPESAVDNLLRLPSAPGPAARSPQLALSAEELGFLHEVLDDEGGGGSDEEAGGGMAAGMPPVMPYEDPPPGTLGRMLHAEIQSELQPEVDLVRRPRPTSPARSLPGRPPAVPDHLSSCPGRTSRT